jgi:ketosteroid isomerase-like protein
MRGLAIGLCLALAGCELLTPVPPTPPSSGANLPPELQRVLDEYTLAWQTRDAAGLASLFADDRVVMPNSCPPVRGRAEVQKCYTGSGGGLSLQAVDHRIGTEFAYIIGEYATQAGNPAAGRFVLTLTKGDNDRWLIVSDMDREYRRQQSQK